MGKGKEDERGGEGMAPEAPGGQGTAPEAESLCRNLPGVRNFMGEATSITFRRVGSSSS